MVLVLITLAELVPSHYSGLGETHRMVIIVLSSLPPTHTLPPPNAGCSLASIYWHV